MNAINRINSKLFKDNLNFRLILTEIKKSEVELEKYPWDECIADQTKDTEKKQLLKSADI